MKILHRGAGRGVGAKRNYYCVIRLANATIPEMIDEIANNQCKGGVRGKLWARWLVLLVITIGIAVYPISNAILRVALLIGVLLLWGGLIVIA